QLIASQAPTTFFYIVNRSAREVRVRVIVDGAELFVQEVDAVRKAPSRIQEAPPPGSSPARELKVPLSLAARRLVVEELNSGDRATYDLSQGVQSDAGFRIVIGPEGIFISRDYLPIRSP